MRRMRDYISATRELYSCIPNPPGYEPQLNFRKYTFAQHRAAIASGFELWRASWRSTAAAAKGSDDAAENGHALSSTDARVDAEDADALRETLRDGVAFARGEANTKVGELREMDVREFAQEQVDLYSTVIGEFASSYRGARDAVDEDEPLPPPSTSLKQ